MKTYVIRREKAWKIAEELEATAGRSKEVAESDFPDDIRWIRSYVISEAGRHARDRLHLPGDQHRGLGQGGTRSGSTCPPTRFSRSPTRSSSGPTRSRTERLPDRGPVSCRMGAWPPSSADHADDPRGLQPAAAAGGLQPLRRRPAAGRGAAARGRRVGRGPGPRAGRDLRLAPDDPLGLRGEREEARAAHPRPLRPPHRRGRVRPLLARADADRGRARTPRARPGASRGPAPTSPAAALVHAADAGRERRRLPDLDDLLGDPGAAQAARAGRRVGAALPLARLRRALAAGRAQARRALRDGDDREAGRLRRPRQHDRRRRR